MSYLAGPAAARADPYFGGLSVQGGVAVRDYGVMVGNGGLSVFSNAGDPASGTHPNDPPHPLALPA